jgi:hypothetical protein
VFSIQGTARAIGALYLKLQSAVETITKQIPHPCFGKKLRDGTGEMLPLPNS